MAFPPGSLAVLQDDRLILRPPTESDKQPYRDCVAANVAPLSEFLGTWPDDTARDRTLGLAEAFILKTHERNAAGAALVYAIFYDGAFIGIVEYDLVKGLGGWLDMRYTDQGIAARVMELFIDHLFRIRFARPEKFERLWELEAFARITNVRSRAILLANGFAVDSRFAIQDPYPDEDGQHLQLLRWVLSREAWDTRPLRAQ